MIDWVEKCHGVSFRHAIELLRANHPSLAALSPVARSRGTTAAVKLDASFKIDANDQNALNQVVEYYRHTLKQSPEALKYLQSRGLEHPEMIDHFRLGFSNRTLCYRIPESNRKDGAEIRGRLQRLGIIRESGHEHFTGSVVIPVIDLDGNVTEIYGRKITEGLRAGTQLHTYLPGPHKGVWNEEALTVSKEIILCESLIDALTFWCADYRNVTTSYGVNGFTDDHREAFKKHGIKKVLIAYDRDEAGEKAARELAGVLISMGMDCYRVLLAHEVLGRSLDELPPQTRRLLLIIDELVSKECDRLQMDRIDYRFSRRDVRQFSGWGNTQLKTHLARLEDLEYLLVHHGGRGQSFVYELVFERSADDDKPVLPNLIDVEKLRYDGNRSGLNGSKSAGCRGVVGSVRSQ